MPGNDLDQGTKLVNNGTDRQQRLLVHPLAVDHAKIATAWAGIHKPLWASLRAIPLFILGRQVGDLSLARNAVVRLPLAVAPTGFMATRGSAHPHFMRAVISEQRNPSWSGRIHECQSTGN
jgi:hypothetical protein